MRRDVAGLGLWGAGGLTQESSRGLTHLSEGRPRSTAPVPAQHRLSQQCFISTAGGPVGSSCSQLPRGQGLAPGCVCGGAGFPLQPTLSCPPTPPHSHGTLDVLNRCNPTGGLSLPYWPRRFWYSFLKSLPTPYVSLTLTLKRIKPFAPESSSHPVRSFPPSVRV